MSDHPFYPFDKLRTRLGSTSLTTDATGAKLTEVRYKAWGEVRYQSGGLLSDRTYTGQRTYTSDFGLMYYNARWYDNQIGRFSQADDIPLKAGDTQSLDRFGYVSNNPVNRNDPTGHKQVCKDYDPSGTGHTVHECHDDGTKDTNEPVYYNGYTKEELLSFWQSQKGHPSGCGAFSIAMATNLFRGTQKYTGGDVENFLEMIGAKISGAGIPSWGYQDIVSNYNPDNAVVASTNNTISDLKNALANNYLPIVAVSWQTNEEIVIDPTHATVGHYMVAVGYDDNNIYLLDPGANSVTDSTALHSYSNKEFNLIWNETSNFLIEPGSMFTIR